MIDTHAHLDFPDFRDDLPEVLRRAAEVGVTHIVTVATNPESSVRSIALAEEHECVSAVAGIHPNDCAAAGEGDWADLSEIARHSKVVGLGETGLDFHRDRAPREAQEKAFRRTISIAMDAGRPLVIHCREAADECLRILRDSGHERFRGVMHCFSGTPAQAGEFLSLGLYVSFAGQLTYPTVPVIG